MCFMIEPFHFLSLFNLIAPYLLIGMIGGTILSIFSAFKQTNVIQNTSEFI